MAFLTHSPAVTVVIVGLAFTGWAQSNSPAGAGQLPGLSATQPGVEPLMSPAKPDFAGLGLEPASLGANAVISAEKGQKRAKLSLNTPSADSEDTDAYLRPREFGLVIPPPPVPRTPFDRGLEEKFRPEPFQFGRHVTATFSVWTAIKRKNPLCLLNNEFLKFSW